jgi:hypothetical protein
MEVNLRLRHPLEEADGGIREWPGGAGGERSADVLAGGSGDWLGHGLPMLRHGVADGRSASPGGAYDQFPDSKVNCVASMTIAVI